MSGRITINPSVCHGKPTITNTRVLVSNILVDLANGNGFSDIKSNYPNISDADIKAALEFGSQWASFDIIQQDVASL